MVLFKLSGQLSSESMYEIPELDIKKLYLNCLNHLLLAFLLCCNFLLYFSIGVS